jgi:methionine-rich copper-binding protein CopC
MNPVIKKALTVALAALAFSTASATSAHTEIDHTTPGSGDSVTAGVQQIEVGFTDKILDLADSSEIVITDPNGKDVEVSCIFVDEKSLNVNAMLPIEGDYQVTWRTVAEDGHPITGKFAFAATGSSDEDFTSCIESISQTNVDEPQVIATPKATAVEDTPAESGELTIYLIGGAVVLAAGAAFIIRSRKPKA